MHQCKHLYDIENIFNIVQEDTLPNSMVLKMPKHISRATFIQQANVTLTFIFFYFFIFLLKCKSYQSLNGPIPIFSPPKKFDVIHFHIQSQFTSLIGFKVSVVCTVMSHFIWRRYCWHDTYMIIMEQKKLDQM